MKAFSYIHGDSIIILDTESFIINRGLVSKYDGSHMMESEDGYLEKRVPDAYYPDTVWFTPYEQYKVVPVKQEWTDLIQGYKENKVSTKEQKIADKLSKIKELSVEHQDIIKGILESEQKIVSDYKQGKKKSINKIVGQVIKLIPNINGRDVVPFIKTILDKED